MNNEMFYEDLSRYSTKELKQKMNGYKLAEKKHQKDFSSCIKEIKEELVIRKELNFGEDFDPKNI